METTELTPQQRIKILKDVLKNLKSFNINGGLCLKIQNSAFKLFQILDYANKIIPLLTLENAKRITDVLDDAGEGTYWWEKFFPYDFENRIKFVKWMINKEKSFLK